MIPEWLSLKGANHKPEKVPQLSCSYRRGALCQHGDCNVTSKSRNQNDQEIRNSMLEPGWIYQKMKSQVKNSNAAIQAADQWHKSEKERIETTRDDNLRFS